MVRLVNVDIKLGPGDLAAETAESHVQSARGALEVSIWLRKSILCCCSMMLDCKHQPQGEACGHT